MNGFHFGILAVATPSTPEPSTIVSSSSIAGLFGLGYAWRRRRWKVK